MGPLGFLCGGGPAPIRDGKLGHITQSCIDAWKKHYGDHPATVCLKADPDPRKPLYYWQLYSLLGEQFATVSSQIDDLSVQTHQGVIADSFTRAVIVGS